MNKASYIAVIASLLVLTACNPSKQEIGTLVGAGAGAYAGSQVGSGSGQLAAVAIGALLGGYLGGGIGQNMDELDRRRMNDALETAPTGKSVAWNNPDTGIRYKTTPTRTYKKAKRPCREYTTEAVIDGRAEVIHGKACRDANGAWRVAD